MNKEKQPQMNIDIKQSTPITDDNGNQVFFGKILIELLPKELREEYEEYNKTI